MATSDDRAIGRPSFLAAKTAHDPVQKEVDALEYYIQHFVRGGLQMTPDEAYPYAVYGIPHWKENRESTAIGREGQAHVWRIYDYPHLMMMYYNMYRTARHHLSIETALSWRTYLERTYGTAVAYYTYPEEIQDWSPYETGNYNERITPRLIEALEAEGDTLKAFCLRRHWEQKVDFFVSGKGNLFASEYPCDPTGFESTHALARYAVEKARRSDTTRRAAARGASRGRVRVTG